MAGEVTECRVCVTMVPKPGTTDLQHLTFCDWLPVNVTATQIFNRMNQLLLEAAAKKYSLAVGAARQGSRAGDYNMKFRPVTGQCR